MKKDVNHRHRVLWLPSDLQSLHAIRAIVLLRVMKSTSELEDHLLCLKPPSNTPDGSSNVVGVPINMPDDTIFMFRKRYC
jgi:hypothetical protein